MAITSVTVKNVLGFHGETFKMEFSDGINVMIGQNGAGKTSLLKMIYSAAQWSNASAHAGKTGRLNEFFSYQFDSVEDLQAKGTKPDFSFFEVSNGKEHFTLDITHGGTEYTDWAKLNLQAVFIPTTEMLSHAKGFLALNQKFKLPFDGTQTDIIVNASLPEARNTPPVLDGILEKIGDAIDGTVIQEDDTFYVIKKDGRKIEFSLEAEGLRKLGLIWKLIRNGLLEPGSILLWDEPEANLNPELFPLVADILLELQKNGVQIFAATHSYNFAKYLEIRRADQQQVQFHNLYHNDAGIICGNSAFRMEDLKPNYIMIADNALLDEIYDM
jgi:hypothetical protein